MVREEFVVVVDEELANSVCLLGVVKLREITGVDGLGPQEVGDDHLAQVLGGHHVLV